MSKSLAESHGVYGRVELTRNEWPRPVSGAICQSSNRLLLILPPVVARGEARLADFPSASTARIGSASFFAANSRYESEGEGGSALTLRCHFDDDTVAAFLQRTDVDWNLSALQRGLDLDQSPVRAILGRIADEMIAPQPGSRILVDSLLNVALVELMRFLSEAAKSADVGHLTDLQLTLLRERVEQRDLPIATIVELAALAGISVRHLSRLFKQSTRQCLADYLREAQMRRARALLTETGLPMKQISFRSGYASDSSFSTAFRRNHGISPKAYRRQKATHLA